MLSSILFTIFLSLSRLTLAFSADSCAMSNPIGFDVPGFSYANFSPIESVNSAEEITNALDKYSIDGVYVGNRFDSTTQIFNFNFTLNENGLPDFENGYSKNIDINQTNFALAYEYILPATETGQYTFTIDQVNQAAAIYIYDNRDMYCCGDMDLFEWLNKTSHFYYIPDDPMYQTNSVTVHLEEGADYVVFMTYLTDNGNPYMFTSMTLPSGQVITNFSGYIYTAYDGFECTFGNSTSSIISEWTGVYPTTYSTVIVSTEGTGEVLGLAYTQVETIYYILTPAAISSSSSTIESSSDVITSSSSLSEYSSETFSSSSASSEESLYDSSAPLLSSSKEVPSVETSRTSSEISSTPVSSGSTASSEGKTSLSNIVSSSVNDISSISASSSQDNDLSTTRFSETSLSKLSDTPTNVVSSVDSSSNGFTNSSSTDHSESRSTSFASTTSAQPSSSITKSEENIESNNNDSILTSTYTDIFGLTRTITLKCSTCNVINSVIQGTSQSTNIVSAHTDGDHNIVESGTTITYHNEASNTNQNTGKTKESHSIMTSVGQSEDSYTIVKIQSDGTSSSASVNIQQAPNVATKYTVGLLISVISLTFQLFFI